MYKFRAFWGSRSLANINASISDLQHARALNRAFIHSKALACHYSRDREFQYLIIRDHALDLAFSLSFKLKINLDLDLIELLKATLSQRIQQGFRRELKALYTELSSIQELGVPNERDRDWWIHNGIQWTEKFREALGTYQNINDIWELPFQEVQLLEKYYYGSKLIIDCLNSECYVSREVRQHIEDTLLVPPN